MRKLRVNIKKSFLRERHKPKICTFMIKKQHMANVFFKFRFLYKNFSRNNIVLMCLRYTQINYSPQNTCTKFYNEKVKKYTFLSVIKG